MKQKFNFKRGSATKKGRLKTIRLITSDHSIYPIYFDELSKPRSKEEIKQVLKKKKKLNDT